MITAKCNLTSQWELTTGEPACTAVTAPCPANATLNSVGLCVCPAGFAGTPVWDPILLQWNGSCVEAAAPANTFCATPGNCACLQGFRGSVSWNFDSQVGSEAAAG